MAFHSYLRKDVSSGSIERVSFRDEHYKEAGLRVMRLFGMPILEAYQLVNKWNVSQLAQRFVYALE